MLSFHNSRSTFSVRNARRAAPWVVAMLSGALLIACGDDDATTTSAAGGGGTTTTTTSTSASGGGTTSTANGGAATTTGTGGTSAVGGSANGGAGPGSGGNGAGGAASAMLSFFVSSIGNGANGANYGGIAGADQRCQSLANAVGSSRTWHAYLSTTGEHARNRIGAGPWFNANDVMIAASVSDLHTTGLLGPAIITEFGTRIDEVNAHDVLTGSDRDGMFAGNSCLDYTVNDPNDFTNRVNVGHSDASNNNQFENWNFAHPSQGCSAPALQNQAGQAHLYCFAIN